MTYLIGTINKYHNLFIYRIFEIIHLRLDRFLVLYV